MEDFVQPPFLVIADTLFVLSCCMLFGRLRDFVCWLLNPFGQRKKGKEGYAHIRDPTEDFYLRRMYGRIVDCWNRPISSAPDAWFDVMDRKRIKEPSGQDVAEIVNTGTSTRCLNLASYNYLGFAASDPYCTPQVVDTIGQLGVSGCSPRVLGGTTVAHTELEDLVAQYLNVEAAITYGMGFATNSSTIPALVGKGCLILSDSLNHSSIVAGARQSGAKIKKYAKTDSGTALQPNLASSGSSGQTSSEMSGRRCWRRRRECRRKSHGSGMPARMHDSRSGDGRTGVRSCRRCSLPHEHHEQPGRAFHTMST